MQPSIPPREQRNARFMALRKTFSDNLLISSRAARLEEKM